ncbi:hypothetical protein Tco_0374976 [Tanacetum coccineum]
MQVNVQFLQQLQPEWSRFVTIVKQAEKIDIVSYHYCMTFGQQFSTGDNYYQAPKPQRSNATSSSTRQSASTRHKGKEVAKPITPQSESVSEEDSDPEQAQRDKEMQKNLALLAKYFKKLYKPTNNNLRTFKLTMNKTEDLPHQGITRHQSRQFVNQRTNDNCGAKGNRQAVSRQQELGYSALTVKDIGTMQRNTEAKTGKDYANHQEKNLIAKTKLNKVYMAKDSEVSPEESHFLFYLVRPLNMDKKHDESKVVDQNAAECVDERVALANLIANLTLDTEENKTILKQLKKANASLTQELEKCKTNLDETNSALGEAISCQGRLLALKDIEIKEGLKTKAYEISVLNQKHDELVKKSLLTKSQLEGYLKRTQRPTFANPRYLKKAQSEKPCLYEIPYDTSDPANRFAPEREETMTLDNRDFEYVKSLEKEIDELESEKADFSNMYDLLLEECVSKDVICSYLHSLSELNAHTELQCMYLHKVKECECLAQKLSKQTESVNNENLPQNRKQAEIHSNVLKPGMYRIATTTTQNREPQLPHASRNTNPHVSKSSGVNHTTSVSRPQLKCYQVKDKLKDVNARTKKPKVVPISASKPKRKANKSVATPHKKIVASDTTIQKSKNQMTHQKSKTFPHDSTQSQLQVITVRNDRGTELKSIHIKFDEIKEMMSDHNSSDLAPQDHEMSFDNSLQVSKKDRFRPQQGLEISLSPLLEEYYNPTHGLAEENNNDQAPNASVHQDDFFNPFCTRVQEIGESSVQEIGESSSRNIDNTDVHSYQPQSHDYRWTRDHPLDTRFVEIQPCRSKQDTACHRS